MYDPAIHALLTVPTTPGVLDLVVGLPKESLGVIRETLLAAQGSLAVSSSQVQLAMLRLNREPQDRATRDYLETSQVFMDNVSMVLFTIHQMLYRYDKELQKEPYKGREKRQAG